MPTDPVAGAGNTAPVPDPQDEWVSKYSRQYGVDPKLVKAMIHQESGGNQRAVSPKGAIGAMQLMPATAKQLNVDPNDPESNIRGGIQHFSDHLKYYKGDVPKALSAYNAGRGPVDQANGIPNIPETQDYVKKIMSNYQPQQTKSIRIQGVGKFQVPAEYNDQQIQQHIQGLRHSKPEIFGLVKDRSQVQEPPGYYGGQPDSPEERKNQEIIHSSDADTAARHKSEGRPLPHRFEYLDHIPNLQNSGPAGPVSTKPAPGPTVGVRPPDSRSIGTKLATATIPGLGPLASMDRNDLEDAKAWLKEHMGHPGAYSPEQSDALQDMLGGPVLGPVTSAHGVATMPEHPVRGFNEVVRGATETAALPLAVANPGFIGESLPYIGASELGKDVTSLATDDPDYQELGGNVAGLGLKPAAEGLGRAATSLNESPYINRVIKYGGPMAAGYQALHGNLPGAAKTLAIVGGTKLGLEGLAGSDTRPGIADLPTPFPKDQPLPGNPKGFIKTNPQLRTWMGMKQEPPKVPSKPAGPTTTPEQPPTLGPSEPELGTAAAPDVLGEQNQPIVEQPKDIQLGPRQEQPPELGTQESGINKPEESKITRPTEDQLRQLTDSQLRHAAYSADLDVTPGEKAETLIPKLMAAMGGNEAPKLGPEEPDMLGQLQKSVDIVGTKAGADSDTALFRQAKQQLGPNASFSDVAKLAQELKDKASKPKEEP